MQRISNMQNLLDNEIELRKHDHLCSQKLSVSCTWIGYFNNNMDTIIYTPTCRLSEYTKQSNDVICKMKLTFQNKFDVNRDKGNSIYIHLKLIIK